MEVCAVTARHEEEKVATAALLDSCRQGDRAAFRRLFDAYKDRVFSIAVYFLQGDVAGAEDITQDVFIRVYTRIGQFRGQAEFTTWLYRVVANACMDEHRRRERSLSPLSLGTPEALSCAARSDAYAQLELNAEVHEALDALMPELRLTVLLRYFEELSYEEIARILNCSQGTVASRLNRGLKALATKLKHLRTDE